MRPELAAIATEQRGIVTRAQALATGYSASEIRSLTRRNGLWIPVRPGAYATRETWDKAAEGWDGQLALVDRAAHFTAALPHLVSHDSAARAWGLNTLHPAIPLVHLTREGSGSARTRHGVKHHRTRLGLLNTEVVGRMRITSLARTAVDIAREHGFEHGLAALDSAMRGGATRDDLLAEFKNMWCWPGSSDIRAAIQFADPGADNPGETLARLMVLEHGFVPATQFPISIPGAVVWADHRIGRHLIELDGRKKYRYESSGGVVPAGADLEQVVWDERTRHNAICSQGFGISRVTWPDVSTAAARRRTWLRIEREKAVTDERFGDQLTPAMAQFAEQMASERLRRVIRPLTI